MISDSGIYTIPEKEYHADPCVEPSLSSGIAKTLLALSPRHAWHQHPRLNPDYKPEESGDFDLGTAAHALILEGKDNLEVIDADSWRTKAAKEAREEARIKGKIPVLPKIVTDVYAMRDEAYRSFKSNPDLAGYDLDDMEAERSLIWTEAGIWLRSRLDKLSRDRTLILDYKTTARTASPDQAVRTALSLGYDIQAAFYTRGVEAVCKPAKRPVFVYMFQETEPPYAVSFIGMAGAFLDLGTSKVNAAINLWRQCMTENDWPGYPNRICWAEPPPWATTQWADSNPDGFGGS